jgi:hypothetical protein
MPLENPKKALFARIHWMKRYCGEDTNDRPYSGGQQDDGWYENNNFLKYNNDVFGAFWPGNSKTPGVPRKVNLDRLDARGEASAHGITVVFLAPSPVDTRLRMVGWYDYATVWRDVQFHPDDGVEYNVSTRCEDAHLIPVPRRTRIFNVNPWWIKGMYRFGDTAPGDVLAAARAEIMAQRR